MLRTSKKKLINCKQCGVVFVSTGMTTCPKCLIKNREELNILSSYLENGKKTTISELASNTNIDIASIKRLLEDGRFWPYKNLSVTCKVCKKTFNASAGKGICKECLSRINKELEPYKCLKFHNNILTGIAMHSRKEKEAKLTTVKTLKQRRNYNSPISA